MSIKHAILGLLARGPAHGYDLKALFEGEVAPQVSLNYGQVHQTLERLREDGLVTPEVDSQDVRRKVYYSLTDAGRRELDEWLATPIEHDRDPRNETYLKLMLARRLPGADPLQVVAVERRKCFEELHDVTIERDQAEQEGAGIARLLPLELAALRLEAFLKWLDRCEEIFTREAKP
ncbi:MAG: PadR family transcriptional regulator [Planctomycetes bacterium]|nr:PadR family transcriptional regulator [Planctomycetota bacterium]